jgi:predicted nucleic acid-binding protein
MLLFLDTNVLLDIVLERAGHVPGEAVVRTAVHGQKFFIAWHSLGRVFYIAGKSKGRAAALQCLNELMTWDTVAPVGQAEARRSLALALPDYEDAMQIAAAEACRADAIITRNIRDFAASVIPVFTPEDFLAKYHPAT